MRGEPGILLGEGPRIQAQERRDPVDLAGADAHEAAHPAAVAAAEAFERRFHGNAHRRPFRPGRRSRAAGYPMRALRNCASSVSRTRSCAIVSRSRTVTVPSCCVWESTVIPNGVPASSCLR